MFKSWTKLNPFSVAGTHAVTADFRDVFKWEWRRIVGYRGWSIETYHYLFPDIQFTGSQKNSTTKSRKLKTPSILEELINTDDQTPPPIPQLDVKLTPDAMTTMIRSFTSVLLANISSVVLANMPMNHMTTKATEKEDVSSATAPNFVSLRWKLWFWLLLLFWSVKCRQPIPICTTRDTYLYLTS